MFETVLDDPSALLPGGEAMGGEGVGGMRMVASVIRPEQLDAVTQALNRLGNVGGMTVTDVRGFGRQKGRVEHYRGESYVIRLLPKLKVEMAVRAEDVDEVLTVIGHAARTGQIGDGKAFVHPVSEAMRIRTGERGPSVL